MKAESKIHKRKINFSVEELTSSGFKPSKYNDVKITDKKIKEGKCFDSNRKEYNKLINGHFILTVVQHLNISNKIWSEEVYFKGVGVGATFDILNVGNNRKLNMFLKCFESKKNKHEGRH